MTSKSSITTESSRSPVHPGEILSEEFLKPMQLTTYRLAKEIGMPSQGLGDIVLGKRSITAATAIRLARYFGTSEEFWMNLQTRYDLQVQHDREADVSRAKSSPRQQLAGSIRDAARPVTASRQTSQSTAAPAVRLARMTAKRK